ncbi:MAG: hypothetical protein M1822_009466 [Bathelium mastoideum]|nr:MAG: hypothetical protein M1822_009466 [Bathelium mastoideum]
MNTAGQTSGLPSPAENGKLEELEEETSRLRRKLDQVTPSTPIERQQHNLAPSPVPIESSTVHVAPAIDRSNFQIPPQCEMHAYHRPNLSGANGGLLADRVIDGLRVDSQAITDTFGLFYEYYAPLLPVIDPMVSPDGTPPALLSSRPKLTKNIDYYTKYPFIFWAIVSVGSRRYTKDVTLLHSLAPRVTQVALDALKEPRGRTILGLTLLITWPFPTDVSTKDVTFTLSAPLVHIGIRMGLHVPLSAQDFHRSKMETPERKIFRRSEAWIRCLTAYQRASCMYGAAPSAWVASNFDFQWRQELSDILNPSLLFQFKLQRLQSQAYATITENGCDKVSPDQKPALTIILKIFDRQIRDMESENPWLDDFNRFHVVLTRLQIVGLHLLRPFEEIEPTDLMQIYLMACTVLTLLHKCDNTMHLISVSPDYIHGVVMIAGSTLLRLLKSDFAQFVDQKDGKAAFLECINVLKLMSCANNDLPARYSLVLAQLWTSDKVFKFADGAPCLNLRTRSRFAISLVLDCVWWWREEFGGQPGVYSKGESSPAPSNVHPPGQPTFENLFGPEDIMNFPFLDDQLWSDIDWSFDPNLAIPMVSAPMDPAIGSSSRPNDWSSLPPSS